jgi:hypothetical protein
MQGPTFCQHLFPSVIRVLSVFHPWLVSLFLGGLPFVAFVALVRFIRAHPRHPRQKLSVLFAAAGADLWVLSLFFAEWPSVARRA